MNEKPFISIAIASYNYGKYLQRGFEAIKRQTFKDIEIVYLDDASTDNSVSTIMQIIQNNAEMNIRLIQNTTNNGLLYTKTRLIQECSGTYIMLCDADDWMTDNCLAKLAEKAKAEDADRIVSEVYDINEEGKIIQIQDLPPNPSKWLWNIHHGCLYKRSLLIDNDIRILHDPDDVYMITKFNQYVQRISWIHEPLYYWYVHDDSEGRRKAEGKSYEKVQEDFAIVIQYIDDTISYVSKEQMAKDNLQTEDASLLELLLMKVYYLQLLHVARHFSIREKIKCQDVLSKLMKQFHPQYLYNKYLNSNIESPMRDYATKIIKFCAWLERMHLMKIGLVGYHFLNKIVYLDQ